MCVQRESQQTSRIRDLKIISLLQMDWHEFPFAPSLQTLATLFIGSYKRLQFRLPRTSPRVWGRERQRRALVRGLSVTLPLFFNVQQNAFLAQR